MLDVALRHISFARRGGFSLRDVDIVFPRSTHTALAGAPGCGASTLLKLIAGELRPTAGDIVLGQRRVNDLRPSQRPLLLMTAASVPPGRWSVEHALVAAVRTRALDREDRQQELRLAAERWAIAHLLPRRIDTLSSTEAVRLTAARIDLMRPAVLLADRILEGVSAAGRVAIADAIYRTLRIHGTTVVSAPSSRDELATADRVAVLDGGSVVQAGSPLEVYLRPVSEAAALATGEADAIPVTVRGGVVDSVIGRWEVDEPPFQGSGVAVVRPSHFEVASAGEDSDMIFGIEEAGFADGRWIARGILGGGATLRIALPDGAPVHKGKLLALRYDPRRFTLLPRERPAPDPRVPTDVVPPMRESR